MNDFELRVQRLERGMRRWKVVAIASGLGFIGLAVLAAAPADVPAVLRCHCLEVVNEKGAVIARLEDLPKPRGGDGGWFTCFGNDGQPKLQMGARVGGDAELRVMSGNQNTDSYVTIGASPEGGGQITLNGPNQAPYVKLAAPPGQAGLVSVSSKTGKEMWHSGS